MPLDAFSNQVSEYRSYSKRLFEILLRHDHEDLGFVLPGQDGYVSLRVFKEKVIGNCGNPW